MLLLWGATRTVGCCSQHPTKTVNLLAFSPYVNLCNTYNRLGTRQWKLWHLLRDARRRSHCHLWYRCACAQNTDFRKGSLGHWRLSDDRNQLVARWQLRGAPKASDRLRVFKRRMVVVSIIAVGVTVTQIKLCVGHLFATNAVIPINRKTIRNPAYFFGMPTRERRLF